MIKIDNKELIQELIGDSKEFPKYTARILNLANSISQGTRPKTVGQLTELINECPEKTYYGWKKWYLSKYPGTIKNATEKIDGMILKLKEAIELIDKKMIKEWVEDLVLEKTYVGLRFQEVILKKIAQIKNSTYRLATPEEESKGIDGFIGNKAISIKPKTYKMKKELMEEIEAKIIFYEKTKKGLSIESDIL